MSVAHPDGKTVIDWPRFSHHRAGRNRSLRGRFALTGRLNTKSMLGGALLGQKKYAEAEPLLLAGYEGTKQREATIPPQIRICLPEADQGPPQLSA